MLSNIKFKHRERSLCQAITLRISRHRADTLHKETSQRREAKIHKQAKARRAGTLKGPEILRQATLSKEDTPLNRPDSISIQARVDTRRAGVYRLKRREGKPGSGCLEAAAP